VITQNIDELHKRAGRLGKHDCESLPRSACDKYRLCCRLGARGGAARVPVQDPLHGLRASGGKQGQSHLRELERQGWVMCATVINCIITIWIDMSHTLFPNPAVKVR
jgi:hypothetical protein